MCCLNWNKWNILVIKLVDFGNKVSWFCWDFYFFTTLSWHFCVRNKRRGWNFYFFAILSWHFCVRNKRRGWNFYFFAILSWHFCVRNKRRGHFFLWHVKKRNDHWFLVITGKCQPSGPLLQCETRFAEFPTGALDPQVGIFPSPLNIIDGFYLSGAM